MEWNVEELKLKNELGDNKLRQFRFSAEDISQEEKIDFIDKMNDNKLSAILNYLEKFEEDKKTMPKNNWGNVKTVSLKAWIKRNNASKFFDDWYHYGECYFLKEHIYLDTHSILKEKKEYYVNKIFHNMLEILLEKELKYFSEHDEYTILKKEVENYTSLYGNLGIHISTGSNGLRICNDSKEWWKEENSRPFELSELKIMVSKYKEIENFIEEKIKEINIKF